MKEISMSDGTVTTVDEEDYDRLKHFFWRPGSRGCPMTGTKGNERYLPHMILPQKEGFVVDHKDGNRRNNCRYNLRYATWSQNNANSSLRKDSTTGYKGVSLQKQTRKYRARIRVN